MRRCLDLASNGLGSTSPNPMVGCVIVKDDKIIGEGYHQQYGEAHAEVNAVNAVKNKDDIVGSTIYVSLEPCSHHGKTPPCANLLVANKPAEVIICNNDPNPKVNGKGIAILETAGIKVTTGILEEEGRELNKRFFTFIEKQRPYIILKWAQTEDGYVARADYSSKWISNDLSRKLVHQWRTQEDAILVGKNTAQYDNPQLTSREYIGKDPIRIVIDRELKLDTGLNLFDGTAQTIAYNTLKDEESNNLTYVKISQENIIKDICQNLFKRNIQSLIIEGGPTVMNEFIKIGLWDEARVFQSPQTFGSGIEAPIARGKIIDTLKIEEDRLEIRVKN